MIIPQFVYNQLAFGETIKIAPLRALVVTPLALSGVVSSNKHILKVTDSLSLTQKNRQWSPKVRLSDSLIIKQKVARTLPLSVSHSLTYRQVTDTFSKREVVIGSLWLYSVFFHRINSPKLFVDGILFTDTFTVVVNYPRPSGTCLTRNDFVLLTSGASVLRLPLPAFDNRFALNNFKINTRSRGGDLFLYRDPLWSKSKNYNIVFNNLRDLERAFLEQFLVDNYGLVVNYIDLYAVNHQVVVTTPQPIFVQEANCLWKVELQLQEVT